MRRAILTGSCDDVTADDGGKATCDAEADGRAVANVLAGLRHAHDAVCSLHQLLETHFQNYSIEIIENTSLFYICSTFEIHFILECNYIHFESFFYRNHLCINVPFKIHDNIFV